MPDVVQNYETDADSGIVNDPNKWGEEHGDERYIVDLLKRVVRVSMETVDLVVQIDGESAAVASPEGKTRRSPILATGTKRPRRDESSEELDFPMAARPSADYDPEG